jgi:hypothetical protein
LVLEQRAGAPDIVASFPNPVSLTSLNEGRGKVMVSLLGF